MPKRSEQEKALIRATLSEGLTDHDLDTMTDEDLAELAQDLADDTETGMRIRINPVTNLAEFIVPLPPRNGNARGAWVFSTFLEALEAIKEESL